MASDHDAAHTAISWRVHGMWAVLVLLPFLLPQLLIAIDGNGDQVGTTLAYYGPAIAALWIAGHATIHRLHRDRRRVAITTSAKRPH